MARGTDVHPFYQRGLRWDQVTDVNFAWVKVSDGGSPYATVQGGVRYIPDTHIAGAKKAGIPVGGYHYAQLTPGPEAQADVFLGEVRRTGATTVVPMLDLEAPFSANSSARDFGIRFCNRVAAAGFRPAVYMSAAFARVIRPDQWGIPGLVIVIARYGAKPEAPGSAQYLGRYDVHQYSSSGALPGSAGAVDLDESYTNNHLIRETTMSGFDNTDFANLMWGNVFEASGNQNFAQWLKGTLKGAVDAANASAAAANANAAAAKSAVTDLSAKVASLSVPQVDYDKLAATVAPLINAGLADAVVAALKAHPLTPQ